MDSKDALDLRNKGHDLIGGRKERRRGSLVPMRRFYGEYLQVTLESSPLYSKIQQDVLFSCEIELLVPRKFRSSILKPRMMVIVPIYFI